jgi:hypothetical protein
VFVNGPFRLALVKVHEDRDVHFSKVDDKGELGRREHVLILTVEILAEPRFILRAFENAQVSAASDENEKPLKQVIPGGKPLRGQNEEGPCPDFHLTAEVRLRRTTDASTRIRRLVGVIPAHVVLERKRVVAAPNFIGSTGTKVKVGEDSLEINRAESTETGHFHLWIATPNDEGRLPGRGHDRVHVEDAAGRRLRQSGFGNGSFGDREQIWKIFGASNDPNIGPPVRLIVENWLTALYPIRFEFDDVELP